MAFQDAHTANIGNFLYNGGNEIINPFLVLRVRRENIVQDTLSQVIRLGPMEYKKPLQVLYALISRYFLSEQQRVMHSLGIVWRTVVFSKPEILL